MKTGMSAAELIEQQGRKEEGSLSRKVQKLECGWLTFATSVV